MKTSIILHGRRNEFSLEQMKSCIALAEKYGGSFRHVVTGLQMIGIEKDDKEALISELPDGVVPVVHRGLNSLIACVGKGHCKNGQMETAELADYIEEHFYGQKLGHKCKIGVSGCGRNCPDAMVKDIAFIGTSQGFLVAVGGKTGHNPVAGTILARNLTIEEAKKVAYILINWYSEHGEPRERINSVLARLGNPLEGITL